MSTFACGGGSSMGYKLAGCEVVAANDIDPEMARHYKANLHPRHYYLCPIADVGTKLPIDESLFGIDILDGSPPCSTFSISGNRESDWGKNKHFREGQAKQVLSDLFFDFLDLAGRIKPKIIVAENVKGMLIGNAKGYTRLVIRRMEELGYKPQVFLINAADCGVPQARERVFFVALRSDIKAPPIKLQLQHRHISAAEACDDIQVLTNEEKAYTAFGAVKSHNTYWQKTIPGQSYRQTRLRLGMSASHWNYLRLDVSKPANTLPAHPDVIAHWTSPRKLTMREVVRIGSFPDDYQFGSVAIGKYMVGMSVPPRMAQRVAEAVCQQWLGVPKKAQEK